MYAIFLIVIISNKLFVTPLFNRMLSIGHLRIMQKEFEHRSADLYESKSTDWTNSLIHYR